MTDYIWTIFHVFVLQNFGFGVHNDKAILHEEEERTLSDIEQLNLKYDRLLGQIETEDVVKFGLIPEFVGRFHIVVPLHSLNEDHLVKILTETKNSLIAQKEFLLAYDEVYDLSLFLNLFLSPSSTTALDIKEKYSVLKVHVNCLYCLKSSQ